MIKKKILLFTFFSCSKIEKENFMRKNEKASSINFKSDMKQKLESKEILSEFLHPFVSEIRGSDREENSNRKRPRIFKKKFEEPDYFKIKERKKYLSFEDLFENIPSMLSKNKNKILNLLEKSKDGIDLDLKKLLEKIDDNDDYQCCSCNSLCSSLDQMYLIFYTKENRIFFKCERCKKKNNKFINLNEKTFEIKTFYFFPFEKKINEILDLDYCNCNIELLKAFVDKLKSLHQEINLVKNIPKEKSKRKGINVSLSTSNLKKKIFPSTDFKKKIDDSSFDLSSESSFQIHENDNSRLSFIDSFISKISSIKSKDKDSPCGEIESLIKKFEIYSILNEIKKKEISLAEHRKKTSIPNSLIEILENKTIEELEDILKKIKNKKDFLNFLGIETFHMIKEYDENKLTISEFQIVVKLYNELYNDFIKSNKEKSYSNYINFSNFENLANTFCIDDFEKICKNYFKADFIAQNYINNNLLILKLNINQILIILECKDQAEINFIIDKTSKISNEYNEEFILEIKKELLKFREYSNYNKYLHIDSNPNLNTNYPGNFRNNDVRAICKNLDTGSTISSIGSFPTSSNDSFNSIIPKKFDTGIYTPYTPQSLLELCKKKY